ncbi:MAG: twin-arginine translocation signal domain-containing protein, partial [Lysobacterales bacterium]
MKQATGLSRRHFLKSSTALAGLTLAGPPALLGSVGAATSPASNRIGIAAVSANFERETLIRPFGFK